MKIRYAFLIFLGAFILQSSLLNMISIWGITPNLILCLVAMFSFLYVDINGMALGILFGLFYDMCSGLTLGVSALAYMIVSLVVTFQRENINKENKISVVIVSVTATLLYNGVYFLMSMCMGSEYQLLYWLKLQPFYVAYNMVIMFILYNIFIKKVVRFRNDRYLVMRR